MSADRTTKKLDRAGVAVVGILIGLFYLGIGVWRHHVSSGVIGLVVIVAYVALLIGLRRRSESAELLSASPADERQAQIMLRASSITGFVLIIAVVIGMLVGMIVQAGYTGVFTALAALGGFTFIGATSWLARHN